MIKYKTVYALILFLSVAQTMIAQHQEVTEKPNMWQTKANANKDSITSLADAFKNGLIHGHFRYFFMATDNAIQLSDYHANAIGGGLKYETASLHGFQMGISGSFIYNIGSSELAAKDAASNSSNRYEIGLFDITNPDNKHNIDKLEELYLKYNWKKNHITFGKQLLNSSFINLQDGRMRPTQVEGLYGEIHTIKNVKLEGGILYRISPRSTVDWYGIGKSIGIYSQGVNIDGTKSNYAGHLNSKYVGIAGATLKLTKNMALKVEELYVDNIMNTALGQVNYRFKNHADMIIELGLQGIRQDAVNNGGNVLLAHTYMPKGSQSMAFGSKIGIEIRQFKTSINYNRITKHGRYLMPREWGRDPFFTFMPRERNEGLGDVHAIVLKSEYTFPSLHLKTQIGLGYYKLPSVTNYLLNKYGMPSYTQMNLDLRYAFSHALKGMEIQLLLAIKKNMDSALTDPRYIINKVDMQNWNFLVNYYF